ncbi:MAG TPA: alanine racemase [Acidimicrobiales bacterium]|nr:alanine racemase [Acidimicrobiales bacterium]
MGADHSVRATEAGHSVRATEAGTRRAWAEVDLGALRHNAAVLAAVAAPAALCAVVKAGGYGHGAVPVARAALEGGASWLAVALVDEGVELREAGIEAPVLLLSEPPGTAMAEVVARRLIPTVYTHVGVEAAAKAVADTGPDWPLGVHVKVDSGMHRVGAAPEEAVEIATAVHERPELRLDGLWTHFATADDPDPSFTARQSARFDEVVARLAAAGIRPRVLHTCNSAGAIAHPQARHDLVRCGLAVYGVPPAPALAGRLSLRPALSLRARVSLVKSVAAGEGISYGLRHRFTRDSVVATVPIGYADGVPWRLGVNGGEVLLGGTRRPVAGAVTMDQLTVDCGDDHGVAPGDEVMLLGRQGDESVDAWEWADRTGTIAYEILCGIGPRIPRVYV